MLTEKNVLEFFSNELSDLSENESEHTDVAHYKTDSSDEE